MSVEHQNRDENPWSRPSVVGSGVLILILVIAGIVILILPGGGRPNHRRRVAHTPTTATPPATGAPAPSAAPTSGACSLPAGSQTVPASGPPQGTSWQSVYAMVVPQAPTTYGPQHTDHGFPVCFAHSPTGALLAAMNFYAAATTTPPKIVFKYLAVDVPRAIKDNTELDDGAGNVEIAAYKYNAYTPGSASVTVVLAYPNSAYEAVQTNLEWTGTDWKVLYPSGGVAPHAQVNTLSGYVPWKDF